MTCVRQEPKLRGAQSKILGSAVEIPSGPSARIFPAQSKYTREFGASVGQNLARLKGAHNAHCGVGWLATSSRRSHGQRPGTTRQKSPT